MTSILLRIRRLRALLVLGPAVALVASWPLAAQVSADDPPEGQSDPAKTHKRHADDLPDRQYDFKAGHKLGKRLVIVSDNFSGAPGASLQGRSPRTSPRGSTWQVEMGSWTLARSAVMETSPEEWYVASDKRATIDARRADVQVSAEIRHEGDKQFVGVVARYTGMLDWLGFWYDGHGELVLGAKKTGSGEPFWELRRAAFDWKPGKTHTLSLRVHGSDVFAYLDKKVVIVLEGVEVVGDATSAGIFSRGAGSAAFKSFVVTGQQRVGAFN